MGERKALAGAIIITLAFLIFALAAEIKTYRVRNTGKIVCVGVQIFNDLERTQPLIEVDWNDIGPGELASRAAYLFNNGTTPITLSLQATDWTPLEAQAYLTLTWTYLSETIIQSRETLPVSFNLAARAESTNITSFTFTAIITASG